MSRNSVRAAIQSYFNTAGIPNVGTVYEARTYINEQDYEQNYMGEVVASSNGSGCVLVVNLTQDKRTRRADTGRGAVNDSVIHSVALELFFASTLGDPVAAQNDYDATVEGIIDAIRTDATLGTGGNPIWSAGEYSPWIDHHQAMPYTDADGMTVFIPGVVFFEAWEWVAGPV
jgi:hypothetical protein